MKAARRTYRTLLVTIASLHAASVLDSKLKPDDCTALLAVDARLADGLKPFQPGAQEKFFVEGW